MAKSAYIGDTTGIAKKIKKMYVGDANGVARKVKKAYIGDANGVARLFYSGREEVSEISNMWFYSLNGGKTFTARSSRLFQNMYQDQRPYYYHEGKYVGYQTVNNSLTPASAQFNEFYVTSPTASETSRLIMNPPTFNTVGSVGAVKNVPNANGYCVKKGNTAYVYIGGTQSLTSAYPNLKSTHLAKGVYNNGTATWTFTNIDNYYYDTESYISTKVFMYPLGDYFIGFKLTGESIAYSQNGTSWTVLKTIKHFICSSVVLGSNEIIIYGVTQFSGQNTTYYAEKVTINNGVPVITELYNAISTPSNAPYRMWSGNYGIIRGVKAFGKYYYIGENPYSSNYGVINYSTNGVNWTALLIPTGYSRTDASTYSYSVYVNEKIFLSVASCQSSSLWRPMIFSSEDGTNFTLVAQWSKNDAQNSAKIVASTEYLTQFD